MIQKKLLISRNVIFLERDSFYKAIEINNNNIFLSNEFVLPYYTNQERREVPIENHAQLGHKKSSIMRKPKKKVIARRKLKRKKYR
jgi:hypothetical protein